MSHEYQAAAAFGEQLVAASQYRAAAKITARRPCRNASLKPWLLVKGLKANNAARFYKDVFGAVEVGRSSTVQCMDFLVSVELKIGALTFMVTDNVTRTTPAKNVGISLHTENLGAAMAKAVSAGAVQEGEVVESGGKFFGKVKDPFGFVWIITSPSNAAVSSTKAVSTKAVSFTEAELWLWVKGSKNGIAAKYYEAAFGAVEVGHSLTVQQHTDIDLVFPLFSSVKLKLGKLTFMVSDVPDTTAAPKTPPNNNIALSFQTEDVPLAIANALTAGAKQLNSAVKNGDNCFCKVKDPFGFVWTITSPSTKWPGVSAQ